MGMPLAPDADHGCFDFGPDPCTEVYDMTGDIGPTADDRALAAGMATRCDASGCRTVLDRAPDDTRLQLCAECYDMPENHAQLAMDALVRAKHHLRRAKAPREDGSFPDTSEKAMEALDGVWDAIDALGHIVFRDLKQGG